MSDNLKIQIIGTLDTALTASEIKKQLEKLDGEFNVTLGVDAKTIEKTSAQIRQLENQIKKMQVEIDNKSKNVSIINDKAAISNINKVQSSTKQLFTSVEKAVNEYSKLGTVKVNTSLDPVTKEVEAFTLSVKKADSTVEQLKFKLASLDNGDGNISKAFELSKVKGLDDRQKNAEQVLQKEHQINNTLDKQNQKIAQQLSLYKQQAQINVKKLERQYKDGDLDKAAIDGYLNSVKNLSTETPNLQNKMDNLDMSFKNIKESVAASTSHTLSFSDQMKIAAERTLIWSTVMTGLYGSINVLQEAVDVLYTIDQQLISIAKVVENADLNSIFDNATESAQTYGRTIDNVLKSVEEIAKLGFNDSEASKLSENALLLATIGEMNDADSANYLVAIMRQYGMAIEETNKVVDVLNELSNKTGASTEDLAASLSKSSSAAQTAGISFEELAGMSSVIVETLKIQGSEAGNFLKTLSTRLLRESTITDLEALGVTVKDNNGELLSGTKIINNLSSVWDNLSKTQQNSVAQSLGGVYHINKVTALLEQQANQAKYTDYALGSYGSGLKELETYQEGLEYKTNQLKASLQELAMSFAMDGGGRNGVVGFLETATSIIQAFNERVEQTDGWNVKLPLIAAGIYGIVKAVQALSVAGMTAKMSFGWISAVMIGAEVLATTFMGVTKSAEESAQAFKESAQGYSDNATRLESLISKHDELKPQIKSNKEANEEYNNVLAEITSIAPSLIESTEGYGTALTNNKTKVDEYIESLKVMTDEQLKNAETMLQVSLTNAQNDYDKAKNDVEEYGKSIKEMSDFVAEYNKKYGVSTVTEAAQDYAKRTKGMKLYGNEINKISQEYGKYNDILNMHSNDLVDYEQKLTKLNEAEGKVSDIKSRQDELKYLNTEYKELSETIRNTFSGKVDASIFSGLDKSQIQGVAELAKEIDNGKASVADLLPKLKELEVDQETVEKATNQLETAVKNGTVAYEDYEQVIESTSNTTQTAVSPVQSLVEAYSALASEISPLNSLLEGLAEGKQITATEALNLIEKEHALADAISVENGVIKINKEAVEKLRDSKISSFSDMQNSVIAEAVNTANATISKLNSYKVEIQAIQSLQDAKRRLAEMDDLAAKTQGMGDWGTRDALNTARTQVRDVVDLYNTVDKLSSMVGTSLKEVGTSQETYDSKLKKSEEAKKKDEKATKDSTKATKDQNSEYKNSIYITDEFKNKLEELNLQLDKLNKLKSKYSTHSQKYRNALQQEIKLLQQQKKLIDAQSKSLESQISSGSIKQYGIIETSNIGTYKTTTTSSGTTSGNGYTGKYSDIINKAASTYGVDPFLIASIIKQESGFRPDVTSPAGARGLMQLMPGTAKSLGVTNSFDPTQNIMGGTKYIGQMLAKYAGNVEKALAAYNAGPGNVAKYNGIPPFSETKKYIKNVLSNFANFTGSSYSNGNKVSSSPSSASSSIADYYLSNFRITSRFGQQEKGLRKSPHGGLDFANGKQGDPIKALKGGKVTQAYYSKTGGYMVTVQQDDGTVAKYMHMQKGLNVKAGDTVTAGQQVGKLGNTGHSTGAHLHLQIEQNGKKIDPETYLKNLQSSVTNTVVTGDSSVAEQMQLLDQAQSDLRQLYGDSEDISQKIEDYKQQILLSLADEFEYKIAQQQNKIDQFANNTYGMSTTSQEYQAELKKQRDAYVEMQRLNELERLKILELMKSADATEATKAELQSRLNEVMNRRYEIAEQRDASTMEILTSRLNDYSEAMDDNSEIISQQIALRETLNDTSEDYLDTLVQEQKYLNHNRQMLEASVNVLKEAIKVENLTAEQKKELTEQLEDQTLALMNLNNEIANTKNEILNFSLRVFQEKIEELDDSLNKAQLTQSLYAEGTEKWSRQLNVQINLLGKKKQLIEENIASLKKSIATEKLSEAHLKDKKKELRELENTYLSVLNSMQDLQDSYRSQITSTLASQQSKHIDGIRESYDKLNESLQDLAKEIPDFSFGEFSDSLADLFYELDRIDKVLRSSPLTSNSTGSVRYSLEQIRSQISSISSEIDSMTNATSENESELENLIRRQYDYSNMLLDQVQAMEDSIRDRQLEQKKIQDALQKEIELKNEQLKQLDEEYEKEDRLKRLQEINDELNKVKNDKRFSYITENGEEILTYDKARVEELEKQRDELLAQYERDDIKQAINDDIERLQESYDKTVEIHNAEIRALELHKNSLNQLYTQINNNTQKKLNQLQTLQNKNLDKISDQWDDLIAGVENGTITFDEMINGWYGSAINDLAKFGVNVDSELQKIKNAFNSISDIDVKLNLPGLEGSNSSGGGSSSLQSAMSNAVTKTISGNTAYKVVDGNGNEYWVVGEEWLNNSLKAGRQLALKDGSFYNADGNISGGTSNSSGNYNSNTSNSNSSSTSSGSSSSMSLEQAVGQAITKAIAGSTHYKVVDASGKETWVTAGEWLNNALNQGKRLALRDGRFYNKNGLATYHEGGVVGNTSGNRLTELANNLFNVKPNEQIVKALKGELYVPPKNIPNIFSNIGNLVNSIAPKQASVVAPVTENHYHFKDITVQANNMDEFINSLHHFRRRK